MDHPPRLLIRLLLGWLAVWPAAAQPLYYSGNSATLSLNTLNQVATNGSGNTKLFTATGVDLNQVTRCTSVAVDGLNAKLFFVDAAAAAIWSANLDGSGLTRLQNSLTSVPTDLALDVLNHQIYFTTSSTVTTNNTIQRIDYTGANRVILFAADGTSLARCTALAVDLANAKIFVADAGAQTIWSLDLGGANPTALAAVTNGYPTGLALDTTNQQVYFTVSSTVPASNSVQRVNYHGFRRTTCFAAAGGVQRCTALDLDLADGVIYLSDAGAGALWRLPVLANGSSPTAVLSGLPATARRVRWFSGPTSRPAPGLTGLLVSGNQVALSATNGFVGGAYYLLTSTNLETPPAEWQPVLTNILAASGPFTLTASNGLVRANPRQFFRLQVQ
jgi:hypothetical protein